MAKKLTGHWHWRDDVNGATAVFPQASSSRSKTVRPVSICGWQGLIDPCQSRSVLWLSIIAFKLFWSDLKSIRS